MVRNCSVKLGSFQIENKVLDFLVEYKHENKEYSILVRDFFNYFQGNAGEEMEGHLKTAYNRASKACDFESSGELDKATEEWKKIFSDDFPTAKSEDSKGLQEVKPVLADYSHCEPLRWHYAGGNKVSIDAFTYNEEKTKWLGGINSDGRSLLAGLALKYIAKTNAVGNFEYYWQVVNTGEAARLADDLRGKIFEGERIRWEHTKYLGKHWIECFIVQDGICIARSGKFFVNIR